MGYCTPMVGNVGTPQERFWQKVSKERDCWEWTANKNNKGYGMFSYRPIRRHKVLAHRLSYEWAKGSIPEGMCVLHTCDNPGCVNPEHHWLGNKSDNAKDMHAKGRWSMDPSKYQTPPHFQGAGCWNAKLTDALVKKYRKQLAEGKPLRQLARDTGLDRKTLMAMRDRKSWKHVP